VIVIVMVLRIRIPELVSLELDQVLEARQPAQEMVLAFRREDLPIC
jgi:hypothetical protein